jgi:hypothetical protein
MTKPPPKKPFTNAKGVGCIIAALFMLVSCVGGTATAVWGGHQPPPPRPSRHDR